MHTSVVTGCDSAVKRGGWEKTADLSKGIVEGKGNSGEMESIILLSVEEGNFRRRKVLRRGCP